MIQGKPKTMKKHKCSKCGFEFEKDDTDSIP